MAPDPYKVLNLRRDASPEEIRDAYRRAARKHHPDHGGDAWAFQQVQEAYEALRMNHPPTASAKAAAQNDDQSETAAADREDSTLENTRLWLKQIVDALLRKQLPLQNETCYFILANMLDFFLTYVLLQFGAIETNPLANFFFRHWGFRGMLAFKLVSVVAICLLAQLIATRSHRHARFVLLTGTLIVGSVVVYSGLLIVDYLR